MFFCQKNWLQPKRPKLFGQRLPYSFSLTRQVEQAHISVCVCVNVCVCVCVCVWVSVSVRKRERDNNHCNGYLYSAPLRHTDPFLSRPVEMATIPRPILLVDSNSWRGLIKFYDLLTRSIYSTHILFHDSVLSC